ncbi:hypothetical protein ABKN59_010054 [Abortiporus biennis]
MYIKGRLGRGCLCTRVNTLSFHDNMFIFESRTSTSRANLFSLFHTAIFVPCNVKTYMRCWSSSFNSFDHSHIAHIVTFTLPRFFVIPSHSSCLTCIRRP